MKIKKIVGTIVATLITGAGIVGALLYKKNRQY